MKAQVTFEFELDGTPTQSDYEQHVIEAQLRMHDALIGNGFTSHADSLRTYRFEARIVDDAGVVTYTSA